jgi:hypothetical protein
MACNVAKDNIDQRKQCEKAKECIENGYDKPLSLNLFEAFGGTMK